DARDRTRGGRAPGGRWLPRGPRRQEMLRPSADLQGLAGGGARARRLERRAPGSVRGAWGLHRWPRAVLPADAPRRVGRSPPYGRGARGGPAELLARGVPPARARAGAHHRLRGRRTASAAPWALSPEGPGGNGAHGGRAAMGWLRGERG